MKKIYNLIINTIRYNHGRLSRNIRGKIYKKLVNKMGENVIIKSGVIIKEPNKLLLGNNISIQDNCFLSCSGTLEIGDNVSMATGTKIFTTSHDYKSGIIRDNKLIKKKTSIGNNVWIGADVIILSGVNIKDNCVIAAGAVVNKDCESYFVYGGVPAKKISSLAERKRNEKIIFY